MKNRIIGKIASDLYDTCYLVSNLIEKLNEAKVKFWAKANSIRHAYTTEAILDYAANTNKNKLKVLNAGGLSSGHQDLSICYYLSKKAQCDSEWTVYESPHSLYLNSPVLKNKLKELSINLKISDFSKVDKLYGENLYDIILFTEIAEHLEHSTLLRCLAAIRKRLKEDGILILTTPNLASMASRIRLLLGNGDLGYWGDGRRNLEKGFWGHIVYYDLKRLKRILKDLGLIPIKQYTFDYGGGQMTTLKRKIALLVLKVVSLFFPNSKDTLFIIAKKGEIKEICGLTLMGCTG